MALDKLTKLTSQSGITTTIDYQMSDLTVDTITVQSGGLKMPVGMSTFQNVTVTGDLTVNGTTTTLDTDLIGVDKLEVSANNTTVGAAITQSGSGDILNLYDGSTEVFSVADGGTASFATDIHVGENIAHLGDTDTKIVFTDNKIDLHANSASRLYISQHGAYLQTTFPLAFLASTGPSPAIKSGGTNNQDLLLTAGTDNPTRLQVTAAGKVGVGRTPTQHPLELQHASEPTVSLWTGSTKRAAFQAQSAATYLYSYENSPLIFSVNSAQGFTERLRIASDGKVGIGLTNPSYNLEVSGITRITNDADNTATDMSNSGALTLRNLQDAKGTFIDFVAESANGTAGMSAKIGGWNTHAGSGYSGQLTFSTRNGSNMIERLRIDSSGRVGINTTAFLSGEMLSIRGGANDSSEFNFHSYADFLGATDAWQGYTAIFRGANAANSNNQWTGIGATTANGWIDFANNSASRITMTSTGVGINETTPEVKLEVDGIFRILDNDDSAPSTGKGLEITYDASDDQADILCYDRGGGAYKKLQLRGSSIELKRHNTTLINIGTGGSGGTVGFGTANALVTNSERIAVLGYSSFKSTTPAYAALYVGSEGNTTDTANALILFNSGGANRGGIGYVPNTGELRFNNQYFLTFCTGSSQLGGTERLRITSAGKVSLNYDVTASNPQYGQLELFKNGASNADPNWSYLSFHRVGQVAWQQGINSNDFVIAKTGGSAKDTLDTERLRITSGGNVDINGTPPWTVTGGDWRNLSISGQVANSGGFIWLGNGAATTNADHDLGRINFLNGATITSQIAGSTQTSANDDGRITFHTKATGGNLEERLRITSAGEVGINNASPATILDIKSEKNSDGLTVTRGSNVASWVGHNGSGDEGLIKLYDGGTLKTMLYGGSDVPSFFNGSGASLVVGYNASRDVASTAHGKFQVHNNNSTVNTALAAYGNNAGGCILALGHSRSGTQGTVGSAVINNDHLGDIRFAGDDGTDMENTACSIIGIVDGSVSGNTIPGRFEFWQHDGNTNNQTILMAKGGSLHIQREHLQIQRAGNNATNFTKGGIVFATPAYNEYHYTWSGQSSYTIDLTCASYFHCEFIYTQHQTNGGNEMHYYARGKWANNHVTHTGYMYEMSGDGAGLSVSFTVSDQSGNGSVDMKAGLTAAGASGASYRGMYGGGNENSSTTANGRLRIAETYHWGSVAGRSLIVKVYYGSFSISKS